MSPLFETERLQLIGWTAEQLPDLMRLHGDAGTAKYLSASGLAWTQEQCRARLAVWMDEFARQRMGKLRLIRKSDGVFVGRAGFGLQGEKGEPELGYALLPEFRGQGYATEAAEGLRDWLFRETARDYFIGFANVANAPSLKVLRSIGMSETHTGVYEGMDCVFLIQRTPRT